MDVIASPSYQPFVVAGLVMAGLVAIEAVALLAGFSVSHLLDHGFGHEVAGGHDTGPSSSGVPGGLFGWINAGRVPALVLIIAALAAFAAGGFAIQTAAIWLSGPLPIPVASLGACLLALPATRFVTRWVSFVIPREETYAITNDDLVGRVAEVTLGPLDQGPAGRIKVQDVHGNWHFPLARAATDHGPFPVGAQVLLVDRAGPIFLAVSAPEQLKTLR